jgi:hypothetical protein
MTKVAWALLAVLVFVSVPPLGAEEVKIIGGTSSSMPPPFLARA